MAPFEELQELWQSQPAPLISQLDVHGMAEQLRRFGRRQTWINLFKLIFVPYTLVRLMKAFHWAPLAMCGAALLYIGLFLYLVVDWRNQIGLSRLDFSAPSVEFVRVAHQRLRHQLNPMRRFFWVFVVTIGGGFNLILLSRPGPPRIFSHVWVTALPFFAYVLRERIRRIRCRRECGAVLEKLESLLKAMENQA